MCTLWLRESKRSVVIICLLLTATQGFYSQASSSVTPISGEGLIQLPGHYFDLEGKTLRFTPKSEGGYSVQSLPLNFRSDRGTKLAYYEGFWQAMGWRTSLPFSFFFGAQSWNEIFVNLNGNISFGKFEGDSWPERDPWADGTMRSVAAALDARSSGRLEFLIAALWSPYSLNESGVYVNADSQSCVVTWEVSRPTPMNGSYLPAGVNVFQARLFPSGAIEIAYQNVPEKDGIVGIFAGGNPNGAPLDRLSEPGDAPDPSVDIASVDVVDAGSVIKFSLNIGAEPPATVPSGPLEYRVHLNIAGSRCGVTLTVGSTRRASSSCGFAAPASAGFQVNGTVVDLYLSKVALAGANQFSWAADAVWWGIPDRVDQVNLYGQWRTVNLAGITPGPLDFSSASGEYAGNLFEVFHYPTVSKDMARTLRYVYQQLPPVDDIAVVFTDFRVDDLYSHGPSTGGINIPIQGIGEGLSRAMPSDLFGSRRLQVSMSPVYVGAPRFAETVKDFAREYRDYAFAVGWIAHEGGHRWGAFLEFQNPLNSQREPLTDPFCGCHWDEYLHAPSVYSVGQNYSVTPYSESSPMGGNAWVDNGDGTFTVRDKPYLVPMGFSALDLYAVGLMAPEEVPETFVLRNVTTISPNRVRATKVPVRIQDIVAALGPRVPSSEVSQKTFKLGVYLIHESGRQPHSEMLARAQGIAAALTKYYPPATGHRMSVTLQSINGPPTALPLILSTKKDTALSVVLRGDDPEGVPLTFVIVSQPRNGLLNGTVPNLMYQPNPDFVGTDNFTFKVNDGSTDSSPATITITVEPVTGPPVGTLYSWILPASARAAGQGGAFYTTDVAVANLSNESIDFTMKFLGNNSDGRTGPEKSFSLPGRNAKTYSDVLKSAFDLEAAYGAIQIRSSSPNLSFLSQTSTPGAGGTFGQSVPLFRPDELIQTGLPHTIAAIREDGSFRTNLILCNAIEVPVDVDLFLSDQRGLLAQKKVSLRPLEMTQLVRVVRELGVSGDVTRAHLIISPSTPSAAIVAYASVIDNVTNDPRTVLPVRNIVSPSVQFLPSSARIPGAGGAFYTTDLNITNTSSNTVNFTVKFLGNNKDGRSGPERPFSIKGGRSVAFEDVLGSVFGVSADYGALRITASQTGLAVLGQTWTPAAGGTFGQSVPAMGSAELIVAGMSPSILAIREDESFRTNLILSNTTEIPTEVECSIVSESGVVLGTKRFNLQPLGMTQVSRVVRELGATAHVRGARLVLSTPTAGGAFAGYASVIDNTTNDPRTLLPR